MKYEDESSNYMYELYSVGDLDLRATQVSPLNWYFDVCRTKDSKLWSVAEIIGN